MAKHQLKKSLFHGNHFLKKFVPLFLMIDIAFCAQLASAQNNTILNQIDQDLKIQLQDDPCTLQNQNYVNYEFSFDTSCAEIKIQNVILTFNKPNTEAQNGYNLQLQGNVIIDNLTIIKLNQVQDVDFEINLQIQFSNSLSISNSNIQGLQDCILNSDSNYINGNLQNSSVQIQNTNLTSQRILIMAGGVSIITSQLISLENFCKTKFCSCDSLVGCPLDSNAYSFYTSSNAIYLSLLQDYDLNSQTFNISASLSRYNQPDLYTLLSNNVFNDQNLMRVQLLIFSFGNLGIQNSSSLEASNIAIYAQQITQQTSHITTTGRGCPISSGLGCGVYDQSNSISCGSTGGSYGGQGANAQNISLVSSNICNEIQSRPLYGNPFNPIFEGSGGGGDETDTNISQNSSSGGGVIYLESILQVYINQKSTIQSNGNGTNDKNYSNGGGSGGSIQIHTQYLSGNDSLVMSNGGDGFFQGGPGSGGRIKLNFTQWDNLTIWTMLSYDTIEVITNSGASILNQQTKNQNTSPLYLPQQSQVEAQNGSIMTSPCPKQYQITQGYKCEICPPGFYNLYLGWSRCSPCQYSGSHFHYQNNVNQNDICKIQCNEDYTNVNEKCLDSAQAFVHKVGGWDVIIPVITFFVCLASFVFFKHLKNNKRKRTISDFKLQQALYNNNSSQNNNNNNNNYNNNIYDDQEFQLESQKRPDFHVEDLPYHMKRIYLHGENTHKKPWKLIPQDEEFEIDELAQTFNDLTKYSKFQTRILWFFKLIYIVSYFWFSRYMKQKNLIILKKVIREHKVMKRFYQNDEDAEQYKYKLSTSQDLSLAYIDIFNYNISVLNWQNKTNFPVCLVLAGKGSFISPFHVCIDDPLCKSLYFTFQQQDEMDSDENILKFETYLKEFNSLAKLIDYSTREKTFLENFSKLVKYVDKQNKKFFSHFGIEADICIHKLVRDKYISKHQNANLFNYNERNLQSRIIMLSYKDQGELINCLKDTHYLKNYSRFYEIKISLNFYIIDEIIHNDQVEIKTEHNINKQIQTYINYDQQDEEVNHLRIKVMKKNYSESQERIEAFIPRYDQLNYDDENQNDSVVEERKCLWLVLIFFYLRRLFGVFKSSFLAYRQTQLSTNTLGILMFVSMMFHFVSVICTFISFFIISSDDGAYKKVEIYIILIIYPFCFAISPLIMIVWLVKHTEKIGKTFMLFNYNAFYTYIAIAIFGLLDIVREQDTMHILIGIAKIIGLLTTWLMSYFGSGYILLQEFI
ncbi:transmembrane protein, putative (macronuclear) [Tetrahymena thermophila SB210]|uniref:Transmembrane protein, putative n=1 Tax=Tetrahymena thermophila (strain SB210) TaxID=312017 RepID=I7MJK0_TETTS|nr:transmembrane protein, putative [Tetrahymena thermophila SB210]EAS06334.2 transmembrane protein, putative [Tetrahymena thermophila SB210]|eukprot:XP_001026579.2 transmembrane protein, putative [Tetrahymena thermophila SB210]